MGAWSITRSNNLVTIAMFDSGVTLDHPDLAGNLLSDLAWDSYYERTLAETKLMTGTSDNGGHGTAVAGVLAAVTNNGTGVAGAAVVSAIFAADDIEAAARELASALRDMNL